MIKYVFLFFFSALIAVPAYANDSNDMVLYSGKCKMLQIGNNVHDCNRVAYIHYKGGRTGFNITTNSGAFMLSGGSDHQNGTNYLLNIDNIRFSNSTGQGYSQQAAGRCRVKISPNGDYVYSMQCEAISGNMPIIVDFYGDNKKVSITHF